MSNGKAPRAGRRVHRSRCSHGLAGVEMPLVAWQGRECVANRRPSMSNDSNLETLLIESAPCGSMLKRPLGLPPAKPPG